MLDIRIATVEDASVISIISKLTFYQAFNTQNSKADMDLFLAKNFNVTETEQEITNTAITFYLAFKNNQLCGYAKVVEKDNSTEFAKTKTLRISRIYLLDTFIGQGLGKILMQHCIAKAKSLNKNVVWLGVWEQNYTAIAFYQKWGFKKFGTEAFLLGNDLQTDWIMKKNI